MHQTAFLVANAEATLEQFSKCSMARTSPHVVWLEHFCTCSMAQSLLLTIMQKVFIYM